jgi:DNA-binding CsgD family transcriptional regulator
LNQYAERRILATRKERLGSFLWLGGEALGAADPDPEMMLLVTLCVLTRLLAPAVLSRLVQAGLTRREIDVLAWVAAGKTNAQAAELLSIAPTTVKKHLEHIYTKLGASSRTEAVATAFGSRFD